ncbi:TPA: cag pathogenicity island Cag12 family protein [Proteus mirabilis]|nr:cag pathogenicity island Cag12 family protein [Proteus mirabilis]
MKKGLWLSVVLLTACSSPPEAPKVDWGKKEVAVNAKIMTWTPIHTVVSSDVVNDEWQKRINNFIPENSLYDDAVYFAIAHSNKIIVEANNGTEFLKTKEWLQAHGANGVIQYQKKSNWLNNPITVYLIKENQNEK